MFGRDCRPIHTLAKGEMMIQKYLFEAILFTIAIGVTMMIRWGF